MFFLLTYWLTNVACFVHRVSGHPNFRPQFRFFSWHTALVGKLVCFGAMWYLDWFYSIIAIAALSAIAGYIARLPEEQKGGWGDVSQSLIFHQVRKYLLRLDTRGAHVKYWRPQFMLVLHGGPCDNVPALEFVDNLKKGGLFVIGDTITVPEQGPDRGTFQECHERRSLWHSFLEEVKFKAFIEVVLERPDQPRDAVANLVMSTGIGGLKPNTLVMLFPDERLPSTSSSSNTGGRSQYSDDMEGDRPVPQRVQHRNIASLEQLMSNSVYDPSAANGCRVTCAFNRELWQQKPVVEEADGSTAHARSRRPGDRKQMSVENFVRIMQDALCARKHILILRSMGDLDKHAIAHRLGKFSQESQNAWISDQSADERKRRTLRRETLNPFVAKAPVQIDVWVLPWTNRADLMLQLQLAFMLSRDNFWTKHSFLRVCSVVGPFSELGGDADADTVTVEARRAELYQEVWWTMRIPATIEVFDAMEIVGEGMWENCRTAATQAVAPLEDTARSSSTQIFNVLNAVIRQQHFNTAVSILAMPDLNERANVDDNPSATKDYMSGLRTLTGGIGPVMLTKAQADSSVITTDL